MTAARKPTAAQLAVLHACTLARGAVAVAVRHYLYDRASDMDPEEKAAFKATIEAILADIDARRVAAEAAR